MGLTRPTGFESLRIWKLNESESGSWDMQNRKPVQDALRYFLRLDLPIKQAMRAREWAEVCR